jgi:hypothetical protein|tara:strand:+ start:871 stop:1548 length:678 start_codon:yes stop_codon:yes gene_type:complete
LFKRLITLGCSQTYGHGLSDISKQGGQPVMSKGPSQQAWPALLGHKLDCKISNMAMPAASNKHIAHSVSTFEGTKKPIKRNTIIVFCWTYMLRSCIIKEDGSFTYIHAHKVNEHAAGYKESEAWVNYRLLADPEHTDMLHDNLVWMSWANQYARRRTPHVYNFSMMGGIDKDLQKLYNINILQDLTYITRQHPLALDNSHLGPEAHKEVANVINTHIMCNQKKEN